MACETLYVQKHVQGAILGESEPAARGIEIHQVLASNIDHLVRTRRATDLEVFDVLMKGAGDEAREVLEKFRGSHAFDPERILATELHIALDENFLPIDHPDDCRQIGAYEGTLDLVMIHSLTEAEIDDWKSLMCLNPSLESVKFVLEFVRYGASRSVEYMRKDLPWLKGIGAEGTRTPEKTPRAESKSQMEDIPREALHLVPPPLEWLPRGRDKSLRPDDG